MVSQNSKRNMKRWKGEERREVKQKVKEEKREFCIENVVLNSNPIVDYKNKLRHNDA